MSLPIITRNEWGAQKVTVKSYTKGDVPINTIYVSLKSNLPECKTKEECFRVLKEAQEKAINTEKIGDIPYSFIIGEDGAVYEGRGWTKKPQKAIEMEKVDFDPTAYDISFFGDFSAKDKNLPEAQFKSLMDLLKVGISKKFVYQDYDLEPFRADTFKPRFRPGKDKFKNLGPIKKKGVTHTKAYKKGPSKSKSSFKGFPGFEGFEGINFKGFGF